MTIKAKRAKSLPVLGKKSDWGKGGMVDETLPLAAESLINSLGEQFGPDLLAWFVQRIGRYRAYSEMSEKTPATNEELRLINEAQRYLLEVRQRLKNLPPAVDAHINAACWKRHGRFFHATGGLLADLDALARETDVLLAIAEQEVGRFPVIRGRKSESIRDSFLADVAAYALEHSQTKITKRKAAEIARDLLVAADVEAPKETVEVERLIRRDGRGRNRL